MAAQPVFKTLALVLRSLEARCQTYSLGPFISVQQGMREGGSASATRGNPIHRDCLVKSYGRGDFREGRGEGQEEGKVRGK